MRYVDLSKKNNRPAVLKMNKSSFYKYSFVVILVVFFGLGVAFRGTLASFFDPVSIVSNVAKVDLNETDGRINVLVLGVDKRASGPERGILTDTMLVASVGRVDSNVVMISLPRDLWVEATNKSGAPYFAKINEIYFRSGPEEAMRIVENVLGVPMHYYFVVDFEIFKEAVDILGGVTINVENEFDDYFYPIEGKENAPENERYEHVHFSQGLQVMNGDLALKYVRSRKGTNGEDTDFARSRRQQNTIMAIKDKVFTVGTLTNLSKVMEMYNLYSQRIDTNITVENVQSFFVLSQQIKIDEVRSFVLDDRSAAEQGGLLYSPVDTSLYGNAYVLMPKAGDFYQVHAYVQRYIFGAL